jgi:methionine-rich copper-binding protein CopC
MVKSASTPRIAASLVFALAATQARAHAQPQKATPPVGGTVASATEIRLEFSETVEPRFSGVMLRATGGAGVAVGPSRIEAGNASILVVPIAKPLAPGMYSVHWHAVSTDTHHTQGDFQFTVKP